MWHAGRRRRDLSWYREPEPPRPPRAANTKGGDRISGQCAIRQRPSIEPRPCLHFNLPPIFKHNVYLLENPGVFQNQSQNPQKENYRHQTPLRMQLSKSSVVRTIHGSAQTCRQGAIEIHPGEDGAPTATPPAEARGRCFRFIRFSLLVFIEQTLSAYYVQEKDT